MVYGQDGLDEISLGAPTTIGEFQNGWFRKYEITPEQYGMERCRKEELKGGSAEENAKITRSILQGERGAGRNAVVLNAAAALKIGRGEGSMEDMIREVEQVIDSGKALRQMERFVMLSQKEVR